MIREKNDLMLEMEFHNNMTQRFEEVYTLNTIQKLYIKTSGFSEYKFEMNEQEELNGNNLAFFDEKKFYLIDYDTKNVGIFSISKDKLPIGFPTMGTLVKKDETKSNIKHCIGKFVSTNPQIEKPPYPNRIIKIDFGIFEPVINKDNILEKTGIEVFSTLADLIRESRIWASLSDKQRTKVRKNIEEATIYFLKLKEHDVAPELIGHIYRGNIRSNGVGGIHHIKSIIGGFARVTKITKYPNEYGVWEGKLEFLDNRTTGGGNQKVNLIKEKDKPSTFFPNHWHDIRLSEEISYALENKIKISEGKGKIKWTGNTKSGIPVEILTDKNECPITIYPIYQ